MGKRTTQQRGKVAEYKPPWKIVEELFGDTLALRQHVLRVHGASLLQNMIRAKYCKKIRL